MNRIYLNRLVFVEKAIEMDRQTQFFDSNKQYENETTHRLCIRFPICYFTGILKTLVNDFRFYLLIWWILVLFFFLLNTTKRNDQSKNDFLQFFVALPTVTGEERLDKNCVYWEGWGRLTCHVKHLLFFPNDHSRPRQLKWNARTHPPY